MVEGHRGSLICADCLTVAYALVVNGGGGEEPPEGVTCALCLEDRPEKHWQSPLHPEVFGCKRCINQSARILEKDPEQGWKRPAAGA